MPGTITHSWNGTVLTISSDSGVSSMDLKGDLGPRGPQGPAGISIGEGGEIDLSDYATKKYVQKEIDSALEDFEPSGGGSDVDLTDYYTKTEVDAKIPDVSNLATKQEVTSATSGLATEVFVTNKIAEAQLSGGEGGNVDLSGYLPKDGSVPMTGRLVIQSPDGLWLDDSGSDSNLYMNFDRSHSCAAIYSDGDIAFTTFDKRIIGVASPVEATDVANKSYVDTAIAAALAALDGDEEEY